MRILIVLTLLLLVSPSAVLPQSGEWKKYEIDRLTIEVPSDFSYEKRQCIHYKCHIFVSRSYRLVITYGAVKRASLDLMSRPNFHERIIQMNGLSAYSYSYSDEKESVRKVSIPSDRIGLAVANFEWTSKATSIIDLSDQMLKTVRLTAKPKGKQHIFSIEPCPKTAGNVTVVTLSEMERRLAGLSDPEKLRASEELVQAINERSTTLPVSKDAIPKLRSLGAGVALIERLIKAGEDLDKDTEIYEKFVANYNSKEPSRLELAFRYGYEFLNRCQCDPNWDEQARFVANMVRVVERRMGDMLIF